MRDLLLDQKSIEEAEDRLLDVESSSERAFVSEKVREGFGERTREANPAAFHSTSSPSPSATARRVSTSTLL
jgi:hypothetical protein